MSVRELKGITPTFQAVLNKQLGKVTDALDGDDPVQAFRTIRTLILMLNPKDKKPLMENDIHSIEQKMRGIQKTEGSDLYQTRKIQRDAQDRIVGGEVLPLFNKVMTILHEGGYLELYRQFETGKEIGY